MRPNKDLHALWLDDHLAQLAHLLLQLQLSEAHYGLYVSK